MTGLNDSEERIEKAFRKINSLSDGHQLLMALKLCERLYRDFPEHPRILQGLGLLRFRTGEQEEGEHLVRRAIELKPDYGDAYYNLGAMLHFFPQKVDEAEAMFRRTIELSPDNGKAFAALANLLNRKLRCQEAIRYCEEALRINPRLDRAHGVMGSVMLSMGRIDDSIRAFRKASRLGKNETAHSSLLFAMNASPEIGQREIYEESLKWGKRHTSHLTRKARPHLNGPEPERRLRVGYVSGDFKQHPVSFYIRPVLKCHNKSQVEVFLYNNFPSSDEITDELAGYADHYRNISALPDEKVEEIVRADGIDILVDLTGHTTFYRLHLFARRPAPVQVSWLGYFNTTGLTAIDYLLSDWITIPDGEERFYAEKVKRLPDCRFCYAPPAYAPDVTSPPSLRLGHVTFCSFNKITKANRQVVALWARILHTVPGSKLMLKWVLLKDEVNSDEMRSRFASHGIGADRLILRPNTPHQEMLAEYGDVDIALDTFPYNGGATTCEALWMGVPVVALEGHTAISRQSAAFLYTIGCREWVAKTEDEYLKIAVQLATDGTALADMRKALRKKMAESPLCDDKRFTANLEDAYRLFWRKWCSEPGHGEIKPDTLRRFAADEIYSAGFHCMADADHKRAAQLFKHVLKRDPSYIQAANNMGISFFMMGKSTESIRAFRRAIRHDRGFADAYSNLGPVLSAMGKGRKALRSCREALNIKPDHVDALINLQSICKDMGMIGEARRAIEKAVEIDQNSITAQRYYSAIMQEYGDNSKAIELLKTLLIHYPDNLTVISTLLWVMQFHENSRQEEIFRHSCSFGEIMKRRYIATETGFDRDPNREHLKIGFVSADFVFHPVGILLSPLFRHHDPGRVSLYCYFNGRQKDFVTDFYCSTAAGWRDIIGLSDRDASALIRKDGIDILIDLSGHTDGYRLPLFSLRSAPVQATWMGYCHTTGLSSMDYIIADGDMIHEKDEKWFTERVVRLPHSRFCFTPPPQCPEVVSSPHEDNGYITFGCFNKTAKITPRVIACWAQILQSVPRSRLILKWKSFRDAGVRDHFRALFAGHGISRQRLEFRASSNPYLMMLEYGDIDIALDTFPFTGGITSMNALWMGVPVITSIGDLPISRQTQSFLRNIELPELVAEGDEQYVDLAVKLAHNPDRLREIRSSLRDQMKGSPLCDEKGFSASVQDLLFSVWRDAARQQS
jgi:predicted O-linked N-acetylglucosamine transferase (SPINDLY family)